MSSFSPASHSHCSHADQPEEYVNIVNSGVSFVLSNSRTIEMYTKWSSLASVAVNDQDVGGVKLHYLGPSTRLLFMLSGFGLATFVQG